MEARGIRAEVSGAVDAPIRHVYDFFREVDLPKILVGRGPLPAVVSVDSETGRWDEPGQTRILHLGDGSQLRERLTRVEPAKCFAYEIDGITGPFGRLIDGMSGRWSFEAGSAPDTTLAAWHYAFVPRSRTLAVPTSLIVRMLWRPYMAQVLGATARLAQRAWQA